MKSTLINWPIESNFPFSSEKTHMYLENMKITFPLQITALLSSNDIVLKISFSMKISASSKLAVMPSLGQKHHQYTYWIQKYQYLRIRVILNKFHKNHFFWKTYQVVKETETPQGIYWLKHYSLFCISANKNTFLVLGKWQPSHWPLFHIPSGKNDLHMLNSDPLVVRKDCANRNTLYPTLPLK